MPSTTQAEIEIHGRAITVVYPDGHTVIFDEWREPFLPPYTKKDLTQLDILHHYIGIGPEWLASDARASIANPPKPYPTRSKERTRSPRWRAGSKSEKPKYFWSKRRRTYG